MFGKSSFINALKFGTILAAILIYSVTFSLEEPSISVKEIIEQEIKGQQSIPLLNDSVLEIDTINKSSEEPLVSNQIESKIDIENANPEHFEKDSNLENFPTIKDDIEEKSVIVSTKSLEQKPLLENSQEIKKNTQKLVVSQNTSIDKKPNTHNPNQIKTEAKSVVSSTKAESVERTITVLNEITEDMITYKKHWSGNHSPSKFVVKINDQELKKGTPATVKVKEDGIFEVTYNYEFRALGRVHKTGGKRMEFKVPKDVQKLSSTFTWDGTTNLVIDKAQLVASHDIG